MLTDKLETPAAGKASVRVINGAASAPSVDVGPANGPAWAGPVKFGTDTALRRRAAGHLEPEGLRARPTGR